MIAQDHAAPKSRKIKSNAVDVAISPSAIYVGSEACYAGRDVQLVEKLKRLAADIRERARKDEQSAVESGLEIGERLIEARALWEGKGISKATMIAWVREQFDRSKSWAYDRINAADAFRGEGPKIGPLLWSTVAYLAHPDHDALKAEALGILKKSGDNGPTEEAVAAVEKKVKEAKDNEKAAKERAREERERARKAEEREQSAEAERESAEPAKSLDVKAEAERLANSPGANRSVLLELAAELKARAETLEGSEPPTIEAEVPATPWR